MPPRLVIVDPSYASTVGHHHALNTDLLASLAPAGWQAEVWGDRALAGTPCCRGLFEAVGYCDPRHWADMPGSLHLAARMRQQLQQALIADQERGIGPPQAWLAHGLLPYQLIGLAQLLRAQSPALVLISLMFAPSETLRVLPTQDPVRLRQQAELNARTALQALAQACRQAGHRLQLAAGSAQTLALHQPLLAAAGLTPGPLHPPVVGAGCLVQPAAAAGPPTVLLHWGDLKPDKGRQEALALLDAVLEREQSGRPLQARWLFHGHGSELPPAAEQELLQRASAVLGPRLQWLQEQVPSNAMQQLLANCDLALLAYSPSTYLERSSGVLWCYAAARCAANLPAVALGYGGHWLQQEADSLGVAWHDLPASLDPADGGSWISLLEPLLARATPASVSWSPQTRQLLGRSFSAWVVEQLASLNIASGGLNGAVRGQTPTAAITCLELLRSLDLSPPPDDAPLPLLPTDPAALEQQLHAAHEEAELTLEQLHLVQEELEVYFLKVQDLEEQLAASQQAATSLSDLKASRDALQAERDQAVKERDRAAKTQADLQARCDALVGERDQQRTKAEQVAAAVETAKQEKDQAVKGLQQLHRQVETLSEERDQALQQAKKYGDLIETAQRMLDGQARYLEDLGLKEERAEQAVDSLRLLKEEILYYIQHSKPTAPMDRDRIKRLVELAKESVAPVTS